jgi:hypothetical protein
MPSDTTFPADRGWRRLVRNWNAFWFTPRDPTLLGLLRILGGAIFTYSLVIYSFSLNDFLGPNAWFDRELVQEVILHSPRQVGPLSGHEFGPCPPRNQDEQLYGEEYQKKFGEWPPCPYPANAREAADCERFRMLFGFDLRALGLPPPQTEKQYKDAVLYAETWNRAMPPPYPKDANEVKAIDDYIRRYDVDPRRTYGRGDSSFSIWHHLNDPFWLGVTHGLFIAAALCFTLGIATRITSFVTWFAAISYITRNTAVVFGVDTMMAIVLLYMVIGPSGAALSVDRLLVNWWRRRRGEPTPPPRPLVTANLAIRLLQVHLCFIYAAAGLSKLLGPAWWNGTALWNVLANFEFAPMQFALYNWLLRFLGRHQLLFECVLTFGTYFTLWFEIMYAVWIWRPSTRWLILSAAILLHGVIGIFMGLGTFALIMLVMNMAFLRDEEVAWLLGQFGIDLQIARLPKLAA